MVSIPRIAGVMSCGFLLCLGMSYVIPRGQKRSLGLQRE